MNEIVTISGPFPVLMDAPGYSDPRVKAPRRKDKRARRAAVKGEGRP